MFIFNYVPVLGSLLCRDSAGPSDDDLFRYTGRPVGRWIFRGAKPFPEFSDGTTYARQTVEFTTDGSTTGIPDLAGTALGITGAILAIPLTFY